MTDIALLYMGEGAWIPGVPARDLNEEEAKTHADAIKATEAAGHRLYVPVTHDPPVKKATKKASDD
ncbi:MAG: hypothetical protein KF753_04995 [Caldilineaceae bacterium]|nr:hypothetical protein [Caldilineaceae bacterium]